MDRKMGGGGGLGWVRMRERKGIKVRGEKWGEVYKKCYFNPWLVQFGKICNRFVSMSVAGCKIL